MALYAEDPREYAAAGAPQLREIPDLDDNAKQLPNTCPQRRGDAVAPRHRPRLSRLNVVEAGEIHEARERVGIEADLVQITIALTAMLSAFGVCSTSRPPGFRASSTSGLCRCSMTSSPVIRSKEARLCRWRSPHAPEIRPGGRFALLGAQIDALNIRVSPLTEELQELAAAAGDVDDRRILGFRQPAPQIMVICPSPPAARRGVEDGRSILEVRRVFLVDTFAVGGRQLRTFEGNLDGPFESSVSRGFSATTR
jgi:hypothetical protein